jgi:hypothetical protein
MMNRGKKIALYNLIVLIAGLTIAGAAVGILAIVYGMPKALAGLGFLGTAGLVGLSPILFRRRAGQLGFDERDLLIHARATLAAYSVFWVLFSVACMVPWLVLERGATIRVVVLPCMLAGGFIIFQLIQAIAILIQHGCGAGGEES